jgi:hypothetical protein
MVSERRFVALVLGVMVDLDGDGCAQGDPGSDELELVVELRWEVEADSETLSSKMESKRLAEMLGRPQLVHSHGMSDLDKHESISSDMFIHSAWNQLLHSSHKMLAFAPL